MNNSTSTPPPLFQRILDDAKTVAEIRYESVEDGRHKSHLEIVRGIQLIMTGLGMVLAAYARLNGVKI